MSENINRRLNIYINDREVVNSARGIEKEMAKVRAQMRNLNKGTEDYDVQLKKLKDTYSKLQTQQKLFREDLSQTQGVLKSIKTALGPVASGFLTAFSITSIISNVNNKIREGWDIIKGFDQRQSDLAATMGKSRNQIAGLTIDSIKYGASTSYSASGVSDLQIELAKLGKTAPEIKAMTKDILNSATALETDLASAAQLVGGQLNSYGENANQAGKFSDILANSVNISATSYEYLATALPKTSAVAALNNVTFEKLNATMGVLADQNVQAETAGTGFRNILLESAKAGKPYQEMLNQVKNAADQSKKAVELFGKENATVAVILANSTDKIDSNTKALENSAGAAEKLAKEKLNSIKGSIEGFSGAWEGFLLSLEKGDGPMSKVIRGIIDFGTGVLNLLTPMQKLSDQIQQEQLDLNLLVGKITSTNISNEERVRLIRQLKDGYPEFVKNIDLETASNEELNAALNKVNENYVKRIALQKQVENVEDAQKEAARFIQYRLEAEEKLYKKLNELKVKYSLNTSIDFGNLRKSAAAVVKEMDAKDVGNSIFNNEANNLKPLIKGLDLWKEKLKEANVEVQQQVAILNRQEKTLGINTEAQNEANAAAAAQLEILKKLRAEAKGLGMKNADNSTEQELKIWLAAYKEKLKYTGEMSEEDKKKRAKELEEARKHSDDLLKEYLESQKNLQAAKRSLEDINFENQKESYEKERQELNIAYDRKIEDLKAKVQEEQNAIDKLKSEQKDPKNSKSDVALLQKQIDNKIALQKIYNETSISLEETRTLKLAALQEKYLNKEIKAAEQAHQKALQDLKAKQDAEVEGMNTLAEAKAVLANYLSADELSKVTSLEAAKLRIKEEHLKAEYKLQEEYLIDAIARIQAIFVQEQLTGIPILTEEERAALLQFLDDAAIKLNNIKNGKANLENADPKEDLSQLSGIDILGFTPEQWQGAFDSLDTWGEKLQAVAVVIGGLKQAFGMFFQFLEAGDKRSLQKFEANNRRKQKELTDQLEKGYISQEIYNARKEKLEQDLAKKKADLEYKQAVRQRIMSAAEIISNTAMGISKAVMMFPATAGAPWTGIIAAIGAAQLGILLAQPLPSKSGFYDGGYTGDGPDKSSPGPVHYEEYVVPRKVLFSNDPVVPSIVGYLEAKRTGKVPEASAASNNSAAASNGFGAANNAQNDKLIEIMERTATVLEKLEENGVVANLVNDLKTAKNLRKKQRELEKLENQAKAS